MRSLAFVCIALVACRPMPRRDVHDGRTRATLPTVRLPHPASAPLPANTLHEAHSTLRVYDAWLSLTELSSVQMCVDIKIVEEGTREGTFGQDSSGWAGSR